MAVVRAETMANANIVFDGNTHANIDVCGNCYEGRLQVAGLGSSPSGVAVRNSALRAWRQLDGMQIGANGVQVLNNEFVGISRRARCTLTRSSSTAQRNTVVRGNYFHDNDVAIMAPTAARTSRSPTTCSSAAAYRPAVQLGSHDNTLFAHNTIRSIDVFLDAKSGASPSSGSVARDNVIVDGALNVPSSKCSGCTVTHNLYSRGGGGAASITATPVFAGGASPTTYAGHVLAAGSPGRGNASDGTDRGIRLQPDAVRPAPAPPVVVPSPGGSGDNANPPARS